MTLGEQELRKRLEMVKYSKSGQVRGERYVQDMAVALSIIERLKDELYREGHVKQLLEVCWEMLAVHYSGSPCYAHVDRGLWNTLKRLDPERYASVIEGKTERN